MRVRRPVTAVRSRERSGEVPSRRARVSLQPTCPSLGGTPLRGRLVLASAPLAFWLRDRGVVDVGRTLAGRRRPPAPSRPRAYRHVRADVLEDPDVFGHVALVGVRELDRRRIVDGCTALVPPRPRRVVELPTRIAMPAPRREARPPGRLDPAPVDPGPARPAPAPLAVDPDRGRARLRRDELRTRRRRREGHRHERTRGMGGGLRLRQPGGATARQGDQGDQKARHRRGEARASGVHYGWDDGRRGDVTRDPRGRLAAGGG